jgi:uncharacterized FlgJ-related protein
MTIKDYKQVIINIFKKYIKKQDNVIYAEKLFVISSIVRYLYSDDKKELTPKKIAQYGEVIDRYIKNEVDIFWKDGNIMVKERRKKIADEPNGE